MSNRSKTCIITGANSGIGKQATIQIARQGYRVVMACRNKERGEQARQEVCEQSGSNQVDLILVDMSSTAAIRQFAEEFTSRYDRLDVLIHNAAYFDITKKKRIQTEEGIELTFATNHLGPVRMTDLLLPGLKRSEQGRLLFVSSKGLAMFPNLKVNIADPEFEMRKFTITKAYYQSKLAQVCYMIHLAEELKDTNVSVHGIRVTNVKIDTNRYTDLSTPLRWAYALKSKFAISPDEMAQTYTWLATADHIQPATGGYWEGIQKLANPSKFARDPQHRQDVIELTRRYIPSDPRI